MLWNLWRTPVAHEPLYMVRFHVYIYMFILSLLFGTPCFIIYLWVILVGNSVDKPSISQPTSGKKGHLWFQDFTLYTICWLHGPRGQTGQRASMSLSQRYGQFSSPLMGFHKWFSEIQRSSEDLLMGFNRWFNHWICWGLGSSAHLGARDHSSRRSLWVPSVMPHPATARDA